MGNYFSDKASKAIIQAISKIEQTTSGEVRVHIEDHCEGDPMQRAITLFEKLQMEKTKHRTGVLLYLATEDKKISILGDAGIDAVVEPSYWNGVIKEIIDTIVQQDLTAGIIRGIEMVGEKLSKHFPDEKRPENELSNEISYG